MLLQRSIKKKQVVHSLINKEVWSKHRTSRSRPIEFQSHNYILSLQELYPYRNFPKDPTPADDVVAIIDVITTADTMVAIKLLKNNKAPGLDMVSTEMLKHGGQCLVIKMMNLLNLCWQAAQIPEEWRKGVIVKLPKKDNLTDCNNWRGVTQGVQYHSSLTATSCDG